jgi:hypothetical protein
VKASNPLQWPDGWERTKDKLISKFKPHSMLECFRELEKELNSLGGVTNIVMTSCNAVYKDQSCFYSGNAEGGDAGVALYFTRKKTQIVMARDAYPTVWENIWSLKLAVEYLRGLERHGGSGLADKAFAGMAALPPPKPWWEVLHVSKDAPIGVIEATFRELAKSAHPDKGGDMTAWHELNSAIDAARRAK